MIGVLPIFYPKRLFSPGAAGRPQMRAGLFTCGSPGAVDAPAALLLFVV